MVTLIAQVTQCFGDERGNFEGVHTDVGHRCIGAKVNGRLVPLSTELESGDPIETARRLMRIPDGPNVLVLGGTAAGPYPACLFDIGVSGIRVNWLDANWYELIAMMGIQPTLKYNELLLFCK